MQLTLHEGSAFLDRERHHPVTLHMDTTDNETFMIDWTPANDRWGQGEVRCSSIADAAGLIGEEMKFSGDRTGNRTGGEEDPEARSVAI